MAAGSLGYVVNDAFVRLATEEGPSVYQVIFLRGLMMAVLFASFGRFGAEPVALRHFDSAVRRRVGAEVVSTVLFFTAMVRMEFANAQAILQAAPLAVTMVAAVVLRERVGARRWVAIVLGFVGVMIMIRPATDAFTAWSLVAVASVGALVYRDLATRRVAANVPASAIALLTALGSIAMGGVLTLAVGWEPMTLRFVLHLTAASVLLFFGYLFSIQAVRVGDLSATAPFRYTMLLGAVVVGVIAFGEVPDLAGFAGMSLILGTGLASWRLDRGASGGALMPPGQVTEATRSDR